MTVPEMIQAAVDNIVATYGDKLYSDEMYDDLFKSMGLATYLMREYYARTDLAPLLEQYVWMSARCRVIAEMLNLQLNPPPPSP